MFITRTILCLLTVLISTAIPYTKVVHNTDPQAKCLDGSSPAVYLHQGSDPSNILFYILGGSSCVVGNLSQSLQYCLARSQTILGSSLPWPQFYPSEGLGILDASAADNKFANWTKVVLLYCDGVFFQGNNKKSISVDGKDLYFRGAVNMRSHLKWADNKFNLSQASKIALTGSSAGGMATYMWIDYLKGQVKDPQKVYGIVDSGIFINPLSMDQYVIRFQQLSSLLIPTPSMYFSSSSSNNNNSGIVLLQTKNLKSNVSTVSAVQSFVEFMKVSNADERPPNVKCTDSLVGNQSDWKCLFVDYALNYLESKLLWVQSEYDQYVLANILKLTCLTNSTPTHYSIKNCGPLEMLQIQCYRNLVKSQVVSKLIQNGHSIWSIDCSWHVSIIDSTIYGSSDYRSPSRGNRTTIKQSVESFVLQNVRTTTVEPYPWPSNSQCAY